MRLLHWKGFAADLGSVGSEAPTRLGTESLQTPRWRELDSKFQFLATLGGIVGLRETRSAQSSGSHRSSFGTDSNPG